MLLTTPQIAACVRGCHHTVQADGQTSFDRIGPAGRAYYDTQPHWALRARCPAGVVLDMITDAAALDIHMALGGGARDWAEVDAVIDQTVVGSLGQPIATGQLQGRLPLPGGGTPRRVQIYLPHCAAATLVALDLVAATMVEPAERRQVLLMLGDSITQGMDARHPANTYAAVAARLLDMEMHNYGIGGAVFARESLPEPPTPDPSLITVAYGVNDFTHGQPPERARDYLEQVRRLYPRTRIVVLAPLWCARGDGSGWINSLGLSMSAYRRAVRQAAEELSLHWVDSEWLLSPGPALLVDGTHPSPAGHLTMGINVARRLKPLLSTGA